MISKLRRLKYFFERHFRPEYFKSGHYYSAVPSLAAIKKEEKFLFDKSKEVYDVDLNTEEQVQRLDRFDKLKEDEPFYSSSKSDRFNIENNSFSYDDAPVLHYMMRDLKPHRVIEIGCGNSSACMLDTSERYLDSAVKFTFIDIDCSTLKNNLKPKDSPNVLILEKPIQEVQLDIFSELDEDDILFIDSSHVSKIGSDIHTIFFQILPCLKKGVVIHFHDIRYPFEYGRELVYRKIFWNEAYLLRAFLQNNESYKIIFWLNYLINSSNSTSVRKLFPLNEWDKRFNHSRNDFSQAGGSIYLRKVMQ